MNFPREFQALWCDRSLGLTVFLRISEQQGGYNASKAGIIQLVKSLAVEFAAFEPPVRVNSTSPGYINTEASGDYDAVKGQWYEKTPLVSVPRLPFVKAAG